MQKSIALALLFGSTSATPGPQPSYGADDVGILFLEGKTDLAPTGTEAAKFALKKSIVESPLKVGIAAQYTGLYGCIRSGNVPMATQGMLYDVTTNANNNENIVVADQTATARSFYQTDLAMMGTLAFIPDDATETEFPWVGYAAQTGSSSPDLLTAIATINGSYFECCAPGNDGSDVDLARLCPTAFVMDFTGNGTVINAAVTSDVLVVNRLKLYSDTANFGIKELVLGTIFDPDFILAAMGQLSDDATSANNWCSMGFKTAVTSAETYSATEGFNSKTKCSWQVSAPVESAPQFALKAATTADNLIQWVEWVGTTANSNVYMTAATILEETQTGSIAYNYGIGAYDKAEGTFFNPFTVNGGGTMTYSNAGDATPTVFDPASPNDQKLYKFDENIAGSPGKATFYQNNKDGMEYQDVAQHSIAPLDMGIFTTVLDYALPAYASYDTALTTFNTDAAAYNEAVDAYNTALEAKEKELPVVMERPCPPTKPAAVSGLVIETDSTWTIAAKAATLTTSAAVYTAQDGAAAKEIDDAKRYGYVLSSIDDASYTTYVPSTAHAGHVFGRLGQGAYNMPGMASPWKWDAGASAALDIQFMMVSIFPENGVNYNGSDVGALLADEQIDIEISSAAYSLTKGFEMPSASATAALALTDKDAAQALVFSAVALAAAVASLY